MQSFEIVCQPPQPAKVIGSLRREEYAVSLEFKDGYGTLVVYRSFWVPRDRQPQAWKKLWEQKELRPRRCRRQQHHEVFACGIAHDQLWLLVLLETGPRLYVLDPWGGGVQVVEVQMPSGDRVDICSECLRTQLLPFRSGLLISPLSSLFVNRIFDGPTMPLAQIAFRDGSAFLEKLEHVPLPRNDEYSDSNVGIVPDTGDLIMWTGKDKFRLIGVEQTLAKAFVAGQPEFAWAEVSEVVFLRRDEPQCLVRSNENSTRYEYSIQKSTKNEVEMELRPMHSGLSFFWATDEGVFDWHPPDRIVRQRWPSVPSLFDAAFAALDKKVQEKLRSKETKLLSKNLELVPFQTTISRLLIKQLKLTDDIVSPKM